MTPVVRAVDLTVGGPVGVLACSFASQIFTPTGSFNAGLLDSEPGKYITRYVPLFTLTHDPELCDRISQHQYSGAFCNGGGVKLRSFMSKPAVRSNLTIFKSDIAVTRNRGFVYILG